MEFLRFNQSFTNSNYFFSMSILFDAKTQNILQRTIEISKSYRHEYVTPEHLLLSLLEFPPF